MAYERRKEFVPRQNVDIRVVKLVISIMQCEPLSSHFFNMQKIEFACKYQAIDFTPIEQEYSDLSITQQTLEDFFERLRRTSQPKFANFIAYMVRNVFAEYSPASNWNQVNQTSFEDF